MCVIRALQGKDADGQRSCCLGHPSIIEAADPAAWQLGILWCDGLEAVCLVVQAQLAAGDLPRGAQAGLQQKKYRW